MWGQAPLSSVAEHRGGCRPGTRPYLTAGEEGVRRAVAAGTGGATNAMDVRLDAHGCVIRHDHRNDVNVQATGHAVRAHQQPHVAPPKGRQHGCAITLGELT